MDFFAELAGRWNAEPRNRATVIAATFAHALAHVGRRPEVTGEQLRALNEVQHAVTADLEALTRGEKSSLKKLFLALIIERATRGGVTGLVDDAARSALESLKLVP